MSDNKLLQAILDRIASLDKKIDNGFKDVNNKMDNGFKGVNKRIDALSKEISAIDDDAPTGDDFKKLKKRVKKLEINYKNLQL